MSYCNVDTLNTPLHCISLYRRMKSNSLEMYHPVATQGFFHNTSCLSDTIMNVHMQTNSLQFKLYFFDLVYIVYLVIFHFDGCFNLINALHVLSVRRVKLLQRHHG